MNQPVFERHRAIEYYKLEEKDYGIKGAKEKKKGNISI